MCMLAIQRLRLLENLLAALSGAAVVHGPSAWRRCICAKLYYYYYLNVMTGEMYQAFLNQRTSNAHTFFLGFCEDQNQASYVEQISREELADKYMAGSPLPSGEKLDLNAPSDLLENFPDSPRLNLLAA